MIVGHGLSIAVLRWIWPDPSTDEKPSRNAEQYMPHRPKHPRCDIGDWRRVVREEGEEVERRASRAHDAYIPQKFELVAECT